MTVSDYEVKFFFSIKTVYSLINFDVIFPDIIIRIYINL